MHQPWSIGLWPAKNIITTTQINPISQAMYAQKYDFEIFYPF
jgi:hypothetical protein